MMILLFFFLFLDSFHTEQCQMTSQNIESNIGNTLNTASGILLLLPNNPYKSLLAVGLNLANIAFGQSSQAMVMTCSQDFNQIISADFQKFYANSLQTALSGFNSELNNFLDSYQQISDSYGQTKQFLSLLSDVTGPYNSHLITLSSSMSVFLPSIFPSNNVDNINGFQYMALPYASVFINLHTLILTDLFTFSAMKNNDSLSALEVYGSTLVNEYCYATNYVTQTYTQTLLNSRTSQIFCSTSGPDCDTGCISGDDCQSYLFCYSGSLNIQDNWVPSFTASGYPKSKNCFALEKQTICTVPLHGGQAHCVKVGEVNPWPGYKATCDSDATTAKNNIISRIQGQLSLLNTALQNEKSTYLWMSQQAGRMCLDICHSSTCIQPGSIVTIGSTSFSNNFLRLNSSSCGNYLTGNGCGTVNAHYGSSDPLTKFLLHRNQNKNWCIISNQNQNFYLRVDGSPLTNFYVYGMGVVNAQYYPVGSDCSGYEEFNITMAQSGFVIQSVAFPNRYLRIDGTGVTSSSPNGGTVNLQYYSGTVPSGYEIFNIVTVSGVNFVVDDAQIQQESGTNVTIVIIGVCVSVGVIVVILAVVVGVRMILKKRKIEDLTLEQSSYTLT